MKKLVTLLLSLVLILSLGLVVGCKKSDPVFGGKYKSATKDEVLAFAALLTDDNYEIDYTKGISLDYEDESEQGDNVESETIVLETIMKDEKFQLFGEIEYAEKGEYEGQAYDEAGIMGFYYNDGKLYSLDDDGESVTKTYNTIEYTNVIPYIGMYIRSALSNIREIGATIEMFENNYGIQDYKLSMQTSDEGTKVKIAYDGDVTIGGTTGKVDIEIIYVFNADKNLTAFKMENSSSATQNGVKTANDMTMTLKSFDGTITLPNDLDTYTAEA